MYVTELIILVLVVATALAFDFTNGFHDTGNAMATSIATGALKPKVAVAVSAVLNLVGAFLSRRRRRGDREGPRRPGRDHLPLIFCGLVGGITWNLVTWLLGLPSSSSHALIGGIVGAVVAGVGTSGVLWAGLASKVVIPALMAPVIAGTVAGLGTWLVYRTTRRVPQANRDEGFRWGQVASASLVSLAHGTNDAQKTMGVITAGADRLRQRRPRRLGAVLGHRDLCRRDRPRHLRRRLADHPHARQGPGGDRVAPGDGGRVVLGRGDPGLQPLRPVALDDAGCHRLDPRLRRRPPRRHRALGGRRADGRRLAADAARRRDWWVPAATRSPTAIGGLAGIAVVFVLMLAMAGVMWARANRAPVTSENVNEEWAGELAPPTPVLAGR